MGVSQNIISTGMYGGNLQYMEITLFPYIVDCNCNFLVYTFCIIISYKLKLYGNNNYSAIP